MRRRLRLVADQRFDLPHFDRMLDNIEDEFQIYNKHFINAGNGIIKNWAVENAGGLDVRINISTDSLLFITEYTGEENIVYRSTAADLITKTLADNAVNYVELEIFKNTGASETVAIWDAIANSQQGEEFSQISDTCRKLDARLVSNTIAPSGDNNRILLATVTTLGGVITDITDNREWFWHSEGDWVFGGTDTTIQTLKDAYVAVTTSIKEMKGTPNWWDLQGISTLDLLERSNYMLIDGGTIDWEKAGVETLRWSANLNIMVPNQAFDYTIDAQSVAGVADGDVIYITLPDEGTAPSGSLSINKVANGSYALDTSNTRNFILAYRSGTKIYFGNGWQNIELESGEGNQLGDGITEALLVAGGLTDENDSTPPYTSTFVVTPGTSWTNAISELDGAVQTVFDLINGNIYNEVVVVAAGSFTSGAILTLPSSFSYEVGKNSLEVYFDGRMMEIGDDYLEIDDGGGVGTTISLTYSRPGEIKVKFRIQIGGQAALGGGGGGSDVETKNEGVSIEGATTGYDFVGLGVNAVQNGLWKSRSTDPRPRSGAKCFTSNIEQTKFKWCSNTRSKVIVFNHK